MADLLVRAFRVRVLWCAAGLVVAAAGCGPDGFQYGAGGQGPGGRNQQVALSAQQEVQLGKEAFEEVKQKEQDQFHQSGADYEQVKKIGDQIFAVALPNDKPLTKALRSEIGLSDKDPYGSPWVFQPEYAVVDSDQVNAFCLPGGKVVVFTGLLRLPNMKDDWLATVLGHEIAHALAHHASERIARDQMYGDASQATGGLTALKSEKRVELLDLLGLGLYAKQYADREDVPPPQRAGLFDQFKKLGFERAQEEEADHIGLFFMTFALRNPAEPGSGYDPKQAVAFWQTMAEQSGGRHPPEILSDHPSDQHRIQLMRLWAARATAAHDAWNQGNVIPQAKP